MLICQLCQKGVHTLAFSRHKRGSSGAGGTWALKAPIHKRIQRPNLHAYKGMKLCTKCLRTVKSAVEANRPVKGLAEQTPQAAA
jgi:hypothetical protein